MAASKSLRVTTCPFYGILVTEKSSLLGERRLAKAHYARTLAHRILSPRLPTELTDLIGNAVTELVYADMLKLYRTLRQRKYDREEVFKLPAIGGTAAEKSAVQELALKHGGALCSTIVVARTDGANFRYIHVSARKNRPDLAQMIPGVASLKGPPLRYANGHMEVQCYPGTASAIPREQVQIWPCADERAVGRLVQFDGIEDAIREWDQGAIESFVKFLGLTVVEDEGLTPRLRVLQTVEWD